MDIGFLRPDPQTNAQLGRIRHARATVLYSGLSMIAAPLTAAVRALVERVRQGHRRRQTVRALGALSERELKDIGLRRSDIEHVADALTARPPDVGLRLADLPDRETGHGRVPQSGSAQSPRRSRRRRAASTTGTKVGTCCGDERAAS